MKTTSTLTRPSGPNTHDVNEGGGGVCVGENHVLPRPHSSLYVSGVRPRFQIGGRGGDGTRPFFEVYHTLRIVVWTDKFSNTSIQTISSSDLV